MKGRVARLALAALLVLGGPLRAAADSAQDEEEEQSELRERLTEREDKRRPPVPWSIEVGGRPLTIGGEYELELDWLRSDLADDDTGREQELFLQHGLELEVYYSFGRPLSLFAQGRVAEEEDLVARGLEDRTSTGYIEREEMWLHSEQLLGSHWSLDVGRLDFEDDRRWWWDADLDAVRVLYERGSFEIQLAAARELLPDRSDRDGILPEHDGVLRVLGEASWDWREGHSLQGFLLYQDDRSHRERPGEVVKSEDADEEDANLLWLGARAIGAEDLGTGGIVGYWLDTALVRGDAEENELEPFAPQRAVVAERSAQRVRGWAFDAGVGWILPFRLEPRVFAGYALGSGDGSPASRTDHSFRQTGIAVNEAGFGGVERFPNYGLLLDPELSNLGVVTVGAGLTLLRSSSLDLVYHHYRLAHAAEALRDALLEAPLDGRHTEIGDELDLVLALEEWEHLELELGLAGFRAGRAYGGARGSWAAGGLFAIRWAF